MAYRKKWLQATDVMVDESTGALLVQCIASQAQTEFDLLAFPLYHVEGLEEVTWDVQFALVDLDDLDFSSPLLSGDSALDYEGLYVRVDYCGVPGEIARVQVGGIATKLSEVDLKRQSGKLLIPLDENQLTQLEIG